MQFLVWKNWVMTIRPLFIVQERFRILIQPFSVAENFTGITGKYVPLKETVRGFKAIVDGEMDQYPEAAFFNVGTIDEVIEKARTLQA